jgi:hypothetical protein
LDEALFKEACDALAESLGLPLAIGFRIRLRKATAPPEPPQQHLVPAQQQPRTYNIQHNTYQYMLPPPGHGMQYPPPGVQYHQYPAAPGLMMLDHHAAPNWPPPHHAAPNWPPPPPVIPQAAPAVPPHTPSAAHSNRYNEPHRPCRSFDVAGS